MLKNRTPFYSMLLICLLMSLTLAVTGISAANVTLSINAGTANVRWFISGESSLVINGFDLDALGIPRPTQVDRISISVLKANPGRLIDAVVYQDANGGSPADAKFVGRKSVDITTTGIVTVTFDAPLTITDRFLWVGFYLPVDFEFNGDSSGTSVLTYWAWTPGGTFDTANLASAGVLGPADGTAPVGINMGGKARITAGVISSAVGNTPSPNLTATPIIQIPGEPGVDFSPMQAYTDCGLLLYDSADIAVTYVYGITSHCKVAPTPLKPESPDGYNRQGPLFDVYFFGLPTGTDPLPYPVTHCLKPKADELDRALFTLGYGAPRKWEVLPTVRYGEYICAEISFTGFVSYVVPK